MTTTSASATPSSRLVGYFSASAAFDKKLHLADSNLPADRLTHLIYAFANVTTDGLCASVNTDIDAINFPQIAALKKQYPSLSVLISVGGASHSGGFTAAAATDDSRGKLAQSCLGFMKTHGFDGIDIDWEFPAAADKANFTALLTALRTQLDAQGKTDSRSYLLTIAAPAGQAHFANIDLGAIPPVVDWINLMTYDYAVATAKTTGLVAPSMPLRTSRHRPRRCRPRTSIPRSARTSPRACRPGRSSSASASSARAGRACPTSIRVCSSRSPRRRPGP